MFNFLVCNIYLAHEQICRAPTFLLLQLWNYIWILHQILCSIYTAKYFFWIDTELLDLSNEIWAFDQLRFLKQKTFRVQLIDFRTYSAHLSWGIVSIKTPLNWRELQFVYLHLPHLSQMLKPLKLRTPKNGENLIATPSPSSSSLETSSSSSSSADQQQIPNNNEEEEEEESSCKQQGNSSEIKKKRPRQKDRALFKRIWSPPDEIAIPNGHGGVQTEKAMYSFVELTVKVFIHKNIKFTCLAYSVTINTRPLHEF